MKNIVQKKFMNIIQNFLKNWEYIDHQLLVIWIFQKTSSIFFRKQEIYDLAYE